jgi:hypothetical protein
MQISTLISHCSELIQIILKSSQPADLIASKYFRAKKLLAAKKENLFQKPFLPHSNKSSYRIFFLYFFLTIAPQITKKF